MIKTRITIERDQRLDKSILLGGCDMKKNKKILTIASIVVACIVLLGIIGGLAYNIVVCYIKNPTYVTTDIANYKKYDGTSDKDAVEELINSFFPYEIQDNFEDVTYTYKAQKCGVYSFEAYLEFTIDDPEEYEYFVKSHVKWIVGQEFPYDSSFTEYTISDVIQPNVADTEQLINNEPISHGFKEDFNIEYCDIRKILCCPEEQRIIFVAICVGEDALTSTEFLCTFFDRFDISPREYAPPRYHYYLAGKLK